jgi:hypothetical protein
MRWAPADYVNDPSVKLALAQRDYVSSTFYPLFLFHAFIQGGKLPADPTILGAILGMRPVSVRHSVAFWTEQGKIKERDGYLYHDRIVRDIESELAFRAEQAHKGRFGGRPAKGKPFPEEAKPLPEERLAKGKPLPNESPPLPLPYPTGFPAPAPPASAVMPSSIEVGREVVEPRRNEQPPRLPADIAEASVLNEIRKLQNELAGRLARLSEHPNSREMVPSWSRRATSYTRKDGTKVQGVSDYRTISSIERLERSIADADRWLQRLDEGPLEEAKSGIR